MIYSEVANCNMTSPLTKKWACFYLDDAGATCMNAHIASCIFIFILFFSEGGKYRML